MNFEFITPITTLFSAVGIIGSIFYVHGLMRQEYIKSDDRWATLKSETDTRWLETQKEIMGINKELLNISQRVERLELKSVK